MTAQLLLRGTPVPLAGEPLKIAETDRLDFSVVGAHIDQVGLWLGRDQIPLLGDGRVDPDWAERAASRHLVGELDLSLIGSDDRVQRPRVVALPSRTTLEGFDFLANALRRWAGPLGFSDPAGRARVWAHLSPRRPERDEEVALVLLGVIRRTLPALHRLTDRPWTDPVPSLEWRPIADTGGGRLDPYALHPWDPPWPTDAPASGQVAVDTVELTVDTAENRFVKRLILALASGASFSLGLDLDAETLNHLEASTRTLVRMADHDTWRDLHPGDAPRQSFLLRDHPDYRVVAQAARAMQTVQSVDFSPLPADPSEVGIRTATLNALYEVWVAQAVRAAIRRRVGLPADPGTPLGRNGSERLDYLGGKIIVRFDHSYPRAKPGEFLAEIAAWQRKQTPDVAVEWHPPNGPPEIAVIDATWSRNFRYHEDKLGYATSLVQGATDPLLGRPGLVCRHALVVYPGDRLDLNEYGWGLTRAIVSCAPSAPGWAYLATVLDRMMEMIPVI